MSAKPIQHMHTYMSVHTHTHTQFPSPHSSKSCTYLPHSYTSSLCFSFFFKLFPSHEIILNKNSEGMWEKNFDDIGIWMHLYWGNKPETLLKKPYIYICIVQDSKNHKAASGSPIGLLCILCACEEKGFACELYTCWIHPGLGTLFSSETGKSLWVEWKKTYTDYFILNIHHKCCKASYSYI